MSTDTLTDTRDSYSEPPRYQVFVLNDDYTPMEFVIIVLQRYFSKSLEEAERIMWEGHHQGAALVGVYSFEVAETKVAQASRLARQRGYPLRLYLEKV